MKGWVPYFLTISFLLLTVISGQNDATAQGDGKLLRSARRQTVKGNYEQARANYLELVRRNPNHFKYNYELGVHYFYHTSDNRTAAIPHLETALANSKAGDTLPEIYFMLGETHHLAGNYEKALYYYDRFKPFVKEDEEGQALQADLKKSEVQILEGTRFISAQNDTIIIENVGSPVNTQFPEYAPVISRSENRIMFTSRRAFPPGRAKDASDDQYYEDIFIAQGEYGYFDAPMPFAAASFGNLKSHDALVSMSSDSTLLLTYRDNTLWKSTLDPEGLWTDPVPFDEALSNANTYTPHGVLTPDGQQFIFSAQRSEGKGGLDLYIANRLGDTAWSTPVNLELLNSAFDEDAPFITLDGKSLYFSSKGHTSMGGYDIFKSVYSNGSWSAPTNLGAPINTSADDIYYTEVDTFVAYYASAREGGMGGMDIYRVLYRPRPAFMKPIEVAPQEEIVAANGTRLRLLMPEGVKAGEEIEVNPDLNLPPGYKVHGYYWRLPNGETHQGANAKFKAGSAGELDSVMLEVLVTNDKGVLERLTVMRPFNIVRTDMLAVDAGAGLDGASRLRLLMPDEVSVGQEVAVNPDLNIPEGYTVQSYSWYLPNGEVYQGETARFKAGDVGSQDSVRLEVMVMNEKGVMEKLTVVRPFNVRDDMLASSDVNLSGGTRLRLLMPDEVAPGQEIAVNPELYLPDGYTVKGFLWQLPGGEELDGKTAKFTARDAEGIDSISLQVYVMNDNGSIEKISVTYPFQVNADGSRASVSESDAYLTSGTKLRLLLPDVVRPGQEVAVNPELTVPEGYSIQGYTWNLPGGKTQTGSKANFKAPNQLGMDSVRLDVMITNRDGVQEMLSVSYALDVRSGTSAPGGSGLFSEAVYFNLNKAGITGKAATTLNNYAARLKADPSMKISIEAHADVRGASSYNKTLSQRRAEAVKRHLIQQGVSSNQIVEVSGKGEDFPLNHCTEGTKCPEKDHAVNRRAVIIY